MTYFVYMLLCEDGSIYTGITNNLVRRFRMHQLGRGGAYTRSHKPIRLIYQEELSDKGSALRREYAIKQLSHADKRNLIAHHSAHASQG
jgi:putative endonuclease